MLSYVRMSIAMLNVIRMSLIVLRAIQHIRHSEFSTVVLNVVLFITVLSSVLVGIATLNVIRMSLIVLRAILLSVVILNIFM